MTSRPTREITQQYLDQLVLLRQSQKDAADAAADDGRDDEEENGRQKTANENLATARLNAASFNGLQALDDAKPVKALVNSLLAADDKRVKTTWRRRSGARGCDRSTYDDRQRRATATANTAAIADAVEDDPVCEDSGRSHEKPLPSGNSTGESPRTRTPLSDHDMKLMAKKAYIDAIGEEMGFDAATGEGTRWRHEPDRH